MTVEELRNLRHGDEVYIIPEFRPNKSGGYAYDRRDSRSAMAKFFGEVTTVIGTGSEAVSLAIDRGQWNWFPEMIDLMPDNLIEISEDDIMF